MGAGDPLVDEIFKTVSLRFKALPRLAVSLCCIFYFAVAAFALASTTTEHQTAKISMASYILAFLCAMFVDAKMKKDKERFVAQVAQSIKETHGEPPLSSIREMKTRNALIYVKHCAKKWKHFSTPALVAFICIVISLGNSFFAAGCMTCVVAIGFTLIAQNLCNKHFMNSPHVVVKAIENIHGVTLKKK